LPILERLDEEGRGKEKYGILSGADGRGRFGRLGCGEVSAGRECESKKSRGVGR